ncbi:DNA polymerase I [Anaerosacchariphilus sp. NSJ-68]|uniref:DNA polymerase I n=2 Tax=Lachnospiraceae TaxID=186803 RepID=A0A923LD94_9FIRM|nr:MULTISPECIES: DNA polymerase I [Lachnospiraceae]MBC5660196.1 DNA polymerase I [Anaerosacchariphilus hominis]MBC5699311.1 DNA polymerase I [Roseburia difficilis]
MREKILLVDGHSIINRAFYGVTDLTNSEGLHTNAIYGFLNTLFKVLDEEKPDYLTVAFDVKAPTFRHKMYDAYKGTRKPMPAELHEQVPVLKDVLHAMGIETMEKAGLEADDLLGTVAKRSEARGLEVTVLSGDRDLLQLATEHIRIRIPKSKGGVTETENYHTQDVIDRYQVTPLQIIELKALMGDTADNIPGVPGIGEKTATNLIVQFGSIENAYRHVEEIKPNRAKEALKTHYDMAEMSKKLATIDIDCDYDYDWEKAKLGDIYTPEAYSFLKRLEFKNMLSRFSVEAPANEKIEKSFRLVEDLGEAENLLSRAEQTERLAFALQREGEELLSLSLTLGQERTFIIPVEGFVTENWLLGRLVRVLAEAQHISCLGLKETLKYLESRMDGEGQKEIQRLAGLEHQNAFSDEEITAYLLNPLKDSYGTEELAKEYLALTIPSRTELFGKDKLTKVKDENPEAYRIYAGYASYVLYQAAPVLEEKLQETGMERLYRDMEMPLVFTLAGMEREGVRVDAEALKSYGDELAVRIGELEKQIYEEAGETFNINSPKQLGVILFEKMGMKGGKKTKTGYSTSAEVLEKLAPEHKIVADILEYRQLTKLKSTYADGLAGYIGADQRIHTTFQQTITATGRLSSTEPNLQNIPIRVELGRRIRKVFIPAEGCVLVDADYSQIELRVLAHMSGDENLIKAYREAQDIHRLTASQVFHIPFDQVTDLQRRNAKAVNFGIVYGISSFGLSQDLSITRKEAQEYIQKYFETYPKIKEFLDRCVEEAKTEGYAKTMFGRRRPMPELKSSNFMQRSFGERVAMNAPIQGTAADIIKIAMIRVDRRLREEGLASRLLLQVHDELLIEARENELTRVKTILAEEMCGAAELSVPLEIDMKQGKNWYEAH